MKLLGKVTMQIMFHWIKWVSIDLAVENSNEIPLLPTYNISMFLNSVLWRNAFFEYQYLFYLLSSEIPVKLIFLLW